MEVRPVHFDWFEYSVFGIILGLSSIIGLYFGCFKGGQDTIDGYMLGGKRMNVFPITMSLITSSISGSTLLGVPSEVYTYGTQYLMSFFANLLFSILTVIVILPVFYNLQLVSLYEYLEMRFNNAVRLLASFLFTLYLLTYIPIVIYGPALALNQVSGMEVHLVTPIICTVCIFYTTLGGLKAVVWSDALQGAIMVVSLLAITFLGISKVGGLKFVLDASIDGDRMEFFNLNPDPTARISFWSSTIGMGFFLLAFFSVNAASVQRFVSLPTLKHAKISIICFAFGASAFISLSGFIGLIIYAAYKDCDPISAKVIERPDQIVPHFVLLVSQNVRGLPGLFVAGVVCAALSTMSTCLNTVAGTIYLDFLEPIFPRKLSEKRASLVMKFLVVSLGFTCVFLVTVIEKLGAILELSAGVGGGTAGTTLGIFLLGLLFPWANAKGTLCGGIVSLITMIWLLVGASVARNNGQINHPIKPMSITGCNTTDIDLFSVKSEVNEVFPLYRLSVFYYTTLGCLISLVVGLLVSFITGPNDPSTVNRQLLSPVIRKFIKKKSTYNAINIDKTYNMERSGL